MTAQISTLQFVYVISCICLNKSENIVILNLTHVGLVQYATSPRCGDTGTDALLKCLLVWCFCDVSFCNFIFFCYRFVLCYSVTVKTKNL